MSIRPIRYQKIRRKEGKGKEVTLLGGGFMERATKRIEKAKELE